jgi:hypothetical protein
MMAARASWKPSFLPNLDKATDRDIDLVVRRRVNQIGEPSCRMREIAFDFSCILC